LQDVTIASQDTTAAGGSSFTSGSGFSTAEQSSTEDNTFTNIASTNVGLNHTSAVVCLVNLRQDGVAADALCDVRLRAGTTYYDPDSSGARIEIKGSTDTGADIYTTWMFWLPFDCYNQLIYLDFKWVDAISRTVYYQWTIKAIAAHTHSSGHPAADSYTGSSTLSHTQNVDPAGFGYSTGTAALTHTQNVNPAAFGYTTGSGNISHADHTWTYTAGISEEALPSVNYDVYEGASSAAPEDDELQAWQNAAVHYGPYNNKALALALSNNTFAVNSRYTVKIKPTGDMGFQVNLQTVHFNSSVTL
jgi:hypothetical protein